MSKVNKFCKNNFVKVYKGKHNLTTTEVDRRVIADCMNQPFPFSEMKDHFLIKQQNETPSLRQEKTQKFVHPLKKGYR